MPRIRTIKPEFWHNEKLNELDIEVHFFAAALLNQCDDEGYFNANPILLWRQMFPMREPSLNPHCILTELSNIGYIELYNGDDGRVYGHVVSFQKHQKINRPTASKIKGLLLDKAQFTEYSLSTHGALTAGKERKGTGKGTGNMEGR